MADLIKKANELLDKLDFRGCLELYNKLPSGNPMIDLVFDRMEALDPESFEKFLDGCFE